jgi:hypothetical protein
MKSFQFFLPPLPPNASIFARFGRWIRQLVFKAALCLLALIAVIAVWAKFGPKFTPTDRSESRSIDEARPTPQVAMRPATAPAVPRPSEPRPANTGNKPYKESLTEKLYEKATGKEVVHRKDGTTYERKQPKR